MTPAATTRNYIGTGTVYSGLTSKSLWYSPRISTDYGRDTPGIVLQLIHLLFLECGYSNVKKARIRHRITTVDCFSKSKNR